MSEVLEQKKPHPFSKEAKEARAKETKADQGQEVEQKEPTFEELYNLPIVDSEKQYEFEFVIHRDSPNLGIANRCEIFDPIQKRIRVIRYSPHEESIFEEDQHELPSGGYHTDTIQFPYGVCYVKGEKKSLVHFMMMHNDNVANGRLVTRNPKFKIVDREADAQKALEAQSVRLKAITLATECSPDDMIPYAKVLNIDIKVSESEVRHKFIQKASENPVEFIKGLGNPRNKRLYVVLKAFESSVITDTHIKGQIHWRGSKAVICEIPAGEMSAEYLTDYTFNSKDGDELYKQLVKMVV